MAAMICRVCAAPLRAEHLDRRLAVVTCAHCGSIFDLARREDREASAGGPIAPREPPERAPVPMPPGFSVYRVGDKVRISFRWFQLKALFLLFFCVAWDSFLVFWYATALTSMDGSESLLMVVFPLVHVAVGVSLTYYTAALFVNTTTVTADATHLRIRHAPLPWYPAPQLPRDGVEQLYITRKVSTGKNGTSVTFELRVVSRGHSGQKLIGGLEELEQALYLEQELEACLGILDRSVAGEWKGSFHQV